MDEKANLEAQSLLLEAIHKARDEVKPDNGRISIAEMISNYTTGELILNPNFQRMFRWSPVQKSRLIESILLGIPLPPLFIAQDKNGIDTVIDGVQRLSTILEFTKNLSVTYKYTDKDEIDEEEEIEEEIEEEEISVNHRSFKLQNLKKIKELNNKDWDDIGPIVQRLIKKTYLSVISISTVNNENTKYELFQRLNTGGSQLSAQEIRNCLIIMKDESFYNKLNLFILESNFVESLALSNPKIKAKYPMELLVRYLVAKRNKINLEGLSISNIILSEFFDDEISNLIDDVDFNIDSELFLLDKTINLLYSNFNKTTFQKNGKGGFNNSLYEVVLVGLAENFDKYEGNIDTLKNIIENEIYTHYTYKEYTKHGKKAIDRFLALNNLSRELFNK